VPAVRLFEGVADGGEAGADPDGAAGAVDQDSGSGWHFAWRSDRVRELHDLGRAFELAEDSAPAEPTPDEDSSESCLNSHDEPK
jgi:hypothetical protein